MSDFETILGITLKHEGGYADHPQDPGGATMKGVTQATYDAWRKRRGLMTRPVRGIAGDELVAIYREGFWDAIAGDELNPGVALALFDFAVNSGPARAVQHLQRALGVTDDGVMGPRTLAALSGLTPMGTLRLIHALCASRLAFVKRLKTWKTFGRGWESRIRDIEDRAIALATEPDAPPAPPLPPARPPLPDVEPPPAPATPKPPASARFVLIGLVLLTLAAFGAVLWML